MVDPVRQEVIALAHTVVVKVGTNVLTGADGTLDPAGCRPWPTSCTASAQPAARSPWSAPGPSARASAGSAWASGRPTCGTCKPVPPSARAS